MCNFLPARTGSVFCHASRIFNAAGLLPEISSRGVEAASGMTNNGMRSKRNMPIERGNYGVLSFNLRKRRPRAGNRGLALVAPVQLIPITRAMVTQSQIAKKLGVSRQLVTFALSGYPHVAKESRERILAAAEEMGYRPNPHARALRRKRTGIIALWIPDQISTH